MWSDDSAPLPFTRPSSFCGPVRPLTGERALLRAGERTCGREFALAASPAFDAWLKCRQFNHASVGKVRQAL
jgi:hypothetical protein